MNSKVKQIFIGLFISFLLLSLSVVSGMYFVGVIDAPTIFSDDSENVSEVQLVNSTLDSSTISAESLKSVVSVYTKEDGKLNSQGSGFVYNDEYIMSNEHVIGNSNELYVQYNNGEWSEADMVGSDKFTDIAIIRPETKPNYATSLPIMTNELPHRGNPVIALGSPSDLQGTVTSGIISGTNRNMNSMTEFTIPDSIQTDAALNSGNSGGPLILTETGEVVGINTATEGENLGFAVSSRLADTIGQSLIETGNHEHSYVGIRTLELSPIIEQDDDLDVDSGLVVEEIIEGSPNEHILRTREDADKPDVIVGVEGKSITKNEELTSYLMRNTTPGDTVELNIHRNGSVERVTIQLDSR